MGFFIELVLSRDLKYPEIEKPLKKCHEFNS